MANPEAQEEEVNQIQDGEEDHILDGLMGVDGVDDVLGSADDDATNASHPSNILDNNRGAKKQKQKTALTHFNDFLQTYWKILRPNEAIPSGPLHELLEVRELDCELFGCFANYLVKCNNKTEEKKGNEVHLSMNSALGYFSAVKMHFIAQQDIRSAPQRPRVFDRDRWHELSSKLTSLIVERHKETGTPLVHPKAAATTDDWKALACVCIWMLDSRFLEFWCVFVALVHMAARGEARKTNAPFAQFPLIQSMFCSQ